MLAAAAVLLAAGAATSAQSARTTGAPPKPPKTFVARVTNPWFPLRPGTSYRYTGIKDGEPTRDVVTVTRKTKVIQGVHCTVVHDALYVHGRPEERTADWYAQAADGTVWYFGEATAELDENGKVVSREGSWQAGVDGARAGIFMPLHPKVGQTFQQEYYKGHAEDYFEVLSLSAHVTTPYQSSTGALRTKEWTPLEPGVVDQKLYIRGVGIVKEQTVKGGNERSQLVSVERSS
jgi:hypothetical protein